MRENAKDAAQWAYERAVADAWRDEILVDDNHESFWPRAAAVQGSAGHTRDNALATAERNYAVGMATDHAGWVHAVGDIHVALASAAKDAADTLAGSLKTASDGLTSDQADAARELADDLATAEADYVSGTAQSNTSHANDAAGPDGSLEIGLVEVANLLREGIVRERGEYETDSYGLHAAAIVAEGAVPAALRGGPGGTVAGPFADLLAYQRQVAILDAAWSAGAAAAKNAFESSLSAVYLAHATAENGPLGSVKTHINATGTATKNRITGLANSDKNLSIDSTDNLADFAEAAQSAASKAAKEGVQAETQYDLTRTQAKRDYNNSVVDAELIRTTAVQDAQLAFTLATPYPLPANWQTTTEYQNLLAILSAALTTANNAYDATVKTAKITHATTIGNAQIDRAETLGDALVTEASETGNAEIAFVTAQSNAEGAFEGNVTITEVAGTTGIVAGDGNYGNSHQTNQQSLTAGLGAAIVQLAIDMKPVNVTHVSGIVAAEGVFHTSISSRNASLAVTYASGYGPTTQQAFMAAQTSAESQWIASLAGPVTAFATAMAVADQDEGVALAQASAAYENARAGADVIHVSARQPLNATRAIGGTIAWRGLAEDDSGAQGALATRNSSLADAYRAFDVDDATAVRTQAVAYAEANKEYWVAWFERGGALPAPPPPALPPVIDPLLLAKQVAEAEADLEYAEDLADAEVEWTSDVAAAEREYADARAASAKALETQTALLQKNQIVAGDGLGESRQLAYVTAQTNLWLAETTAANGRRTAEDLALANLGGADYAAQAAAIASIDASIGLPWTEYVAGKAAAESSWWTTSERDNFLALSATTNAADLAYQTTVIAAYTTWAALTIAAERAYGDAQAEQWRLESIARAEADVVYTTTVSAAEETWHNGRAVNLRNRRIDFWTDRRDAIAAHDTTFVMTWEIISILPDPADLPLDRALDVAVLLAGGQRTVSEIVARQGGGTGLQPAETAYFTATASADEGYTIAESNAFYTRGAAIATASASHDVLETDTLEDAIAALALASPSPWASYDAAAADASADYTGAVAPAARDAVIAELDADRDFAQTMATAEHVALLAVLAAKQTRETVIINAAVTRAQGQLNLQTTAAAAPNVPVSALGAVEPAPENVGPGLPTPVPPPPGDAPPADPNAPVKAETFEQILAKLKKKWSGSPEELLNQFMNGVIEGFFDGVKGTFTLVTTWGEYGFYTGTKTGWVLRTAQLWAGWDDPIAEQEATLEAFGGYLTSLGNSAAISWKDRDIIAANFALKAAGLYVQVRDLRKEAAKWLNENGDKLIQAILNGDAEELERLKKGMDPRLQAALDTVYAAAVAIVDMAGDKLNAHDIGYLVGALLYEACEDAVITAAWGTLTAGTVGAASAGAPAVVGARLANLTAKMAIWAKKLHLDDAFGKRIMDTITEALEKLGKKAPDVDVPSTRRRPDGQIDVPRLPDGCFVAGTSVWLSAVPATVMVGAVAAAESTRQLAGADDSLETGCDECWPIEAVPLGARVSAKNPRRDDYDFSLPEPDQATWQRILLRHHHPSGLKVDMELLRPVAWIKAYGLEVGRSLSTVMTDMRFAGEVTVVEIDECPIIADGLGCVVTGRFVTQLAQALARVTFAGGTELIGTPWHPVWSTKRDAWVGLSELACGETVGARGGQVVVEGVALLNGDEPVYNIEVHGEHVYEVTNLGVVVHNNDPRCVRLAELLRQSHTAPLTGADLAEFDTLVAALRDGQLRPKDLKKAGLLDDELSDLKNKALDARPDHFDINKIVQDMSKTKQTLDDAIRRAKLDPTDELLEAAVKEAQGNFDSLKEAFDRFQQARHDRNRTGQ